MEPSPVTSIATVQWYAVYTKHQHEKSIAQQLTEKGFEVFLPLYSEVHRWKDRNRVVQLPLFPSYLFLHTDMARKVEILRTPGVFWLVGNREYAETVPAEEIEAIRRLLEGPARIQPHPYLTSGDRVRVRSGPLAGLEGILIRAKNQHRIIVSVELLKQSAAVEVDIATVERLPAPRARTASSC